MASSSVPLNTGLTPQTQPLRMASSSVPLNTTPMPHQTQPSRMASSSVPLNTGLTPPQAVSRAENLIDLQSEQNWRPAAQMRGSLTGQAYSAALSQVFGNTPQPSQAPIPRPPLSPAPLSPRLQALAGRLHSQVPQVNRAANVSNPIEPSSAQPQGLQGSN